MRLRPLLVGMLILVAPAVAAEPLSTFELQRQHSALAGQKVSVSGWLSKCDLRNCWLAPTEASAGDPGAADYVIWVGEGRRPVETALASASLKYVTLTARVTTNCWSVCPGRGDNVIPLSVTIMPPRSKGR